MRYVGSIKKARKGFALMASIWVATFLFAVLIATLVLVQSDVDSNVEDTHFSRAWQYAHSGLSLGAYPEIQRDDPLLHQKETALGDGYEVAITAEAARLNINHVLEKQDRGLLHNLFKIWGLQDAEADDLIGALLDWVDEDALLSLNGAEQEYYQSIGFVDRPYNRPFSSLDELTLVRGFNVVEKNQPNWRAYFTLYSEGALAIYEALPQLVAAAAEVNAPIVEEMQKRALGEDGILETEDDQKYASLDEALNAIGSPLERREVIRPRFTEQGQILRVESVGFSGSYGCKINAVIGSQGNILHYEEEKTTRE